MDDAGFNKLMEEQRARARAAQKKQVISCRKIETPDADKFIGYDQSDDHVEGAGAWSSEGQDRRHPRYLRLSTPRWAGRSATRANRRSGGQLWHIANTQKAGQPGCISSTASGLRPAVGSHGDAQRRTDAAATPFSGTTPSRTCSTGRCTKSSATRPRKRAPTSARTS